MRMVNRTRSNTLTVGLLFNCIQWPVLLFETIPKLVGHYFYVSIGIINSFKLNITIIK